MPNHKRDQQRADANKTGFYEKGRLAISKFFGKLSLRPKKGAMGHAHPKSEARGDFAEILIDPDGWQLIEEYLSAECREFLREGEKAEQFKKSSEISRAPRLVKPVVVPSCPEPDCQGPSEASQSVGFQNFSPGPNPYYQRPPVSWPGWYTDAHCVENNLFPRWAVELAAVPLPNSRNEQRGWLLARLCWYLDVYPPFKPNQTLAQLAAIPRREWPRTRLPKDARPDGNKVPPREADEVVSSSCGTGSSSARPATPTPPTATALTPPPESIHAAHHPLDTNGLPGVDGTPRRQDQDDTPTPGSAALDSAFDEEDSARDACDSDSETDRREIEKIFRQSSAKDPFWDLGGRQVRGSMSWRLYPGHRRDFSPSQIYVDPDCRGVAGEEGE